MTATLDPFFTPSHVAKRLVAHIQQANPGTILDPAAGDGALLDAAQARWTHSKIFALDYDPARLAELGAHDGWAKGRCDFLSERSRRASPVLRSLRHQVDVVVLNPPYSGRGNARWTSVVGGIRASSGRAMAFVLTALEVIREGGEMVALLPSSAVTSQREVDAWDVLGRRATTTILDQFPRGTFRRGTASTVAVHIRKTSQGACSGRTAAKSPAVPSHTADLVRGLVQVHEANSFGLAAGSERLGRVPFVHTTNLQDGAIADVRTLPSALVAGRTLGPAVLFPRVGKPMHAKVVLWPGGDVVLSDCVFGLEAKNDPAARQLLHLLHREFAVVAAAYKGSCAPYLTISALVESLGQLGISARWRGPARWAAPSTNWTALG